MSVRNSATNGISFVKRSKDSIPIILPCWRVCRSIERVQHGTAPLELDVYSFLHFIFTIDKFHPKKNEKKKMKKLVKPMVKCKYHSAQIVNEIILIIDFFTVVDIYHFEKPKHTADRKQGCRSLILQKLI